MSVKTALVVGAAGFLASNFISVTPVNWRVYPVHCRPNPATGQILIDKGGPFSYESSGIDGVIFFQGIPPSTSFEKSTPQTLRNHFDSAIGVPLAFLQQQASHLNNWASIIFVGSTSAHIGGFDPSYSSAQAAKSGLVASLRRALPNTRINLVTLGLVEGSPVEEQMSSDFREAHLSRMRTGRLVQPSNVSSLIWHCLENSDLDGEEIRLDGGATK